MANASPDARRRPKRANGDGTVYRDPRGHWVAAVMVDGRRIKRTGRTKTEARQRLAEAKAQLLTGVPVGNRNVTVSAWLRYWLEDVLPCTVSERTEEWYSTVGRSYIEPISAKGAFMRSPQPT